MSRVPSSKRTTRTPPAINSITVAGFKSIADEQTLEVRPLTILAGSNSSGKSSMMQPMLLLKQTLEAQYDPGPLLLNGPNAKFTSARQFTSLTTPKGDAQRFSVGVGISNESRIKIGFRLDGKARKLDLDYNEITVDDKSVKISINSRSDDLLEYLKGVLSYPKVFRSTLDKLGAPEVRAIRERFFFEIQVREEDEPERDYLFRVMTPGDPFGRYIQEIIHLPGLRGNPERTYPVTAIGPRYPGTFENYVASIISRWGTDSTTKLEELGEDLGLLGLTWKVEARPVDDTQVELRVGRLKKPKRGGAHDLVSVADVGFGVSQTLPVVVALRAARPGQLVYIEQPEIHLHPRAQCAMAELLAKAASRGVRVIVETHSSLLLLAVQALVAEGTLLPSQVKLNWFLRDEDEGITHIQPADLDEAGRFGDWPEDFAHVALTAENRYLSAAETRLTGGKKGG